MNSRTFIVTDNENRMKSAFKDSCCRIGCSIHYLNKQLKHSFTSKEVDKVKVNCNIAQNMFSNIRKIVAHVTQCHKQCKLSHKLQSYCDTRFNGTIITMDSPTSVGHIIIITMDIFLLIFDELIGVLDSDFMNHYLSIDKELLECICCFLKAFDETIEELGKDSVPTIHKVLPLREYLLNHCQVNDDDNDGIKEINTFLGILLIQRIWAFPPLL